MRMLNWIAGSCLCAAVCAPAFAAPTDIVIDDQKVFPESLSAAPDGTLYIGGSATGVIYVAKPGESHAKPWISKEQGDFHFVLGVLVDAPKHTLYVCDDIPADKKAWLKTFALSTGKPLKSYALPDGGLCNDIAINHGTAYITDTFGGRVLKLGPGAADLTVWYSDPSDPSLDGLVWADANTLYTNTYRSNHLIRIVKNKDGSAGKGEALNTSMPLFQPDGMRLSSDGRVLMIEGQGRPGAGLKEGRLDLVTVEGDSATITVLKSGFELPVAVTVVGPTAWVLESKFDFQRNEDLKGKDPGTFHAYAVPVPKGR